MESSPEGSISSPMLLNIYEIIKYTLMLFFRRGLNEITLNLFQKNNPVFFFQALRIGRLKPIKGLKSNELKKLLRTHRGGTASWKVLQDVSHCLYR